MKIGVIIQARMNSERLPGKSLVPVRGKPMLLYLLERLENHSYVKGLKVVVATSIEFSDDPIALFCTNRGTACYRGSLIDVAGRFVEVIEHNRFDAFIRLSGDSPLLDPGIIEQAVNLFLGVDCDVVTNIFPRSFPKGQSVEIVNTKSFIKAYQKMQAPEDFEHVTKHFYKYSKDYTIVNFSSANDYSHMQLSVDTEQDLVKFTSILGQMNRPHWEYTFNDIIGIKESIETDEKVI